MDRMGYSFGFFLGDGCLAATSAGKKQVIFRKPDKEPLERIQAEVSRVFGKIYKVSPYPGQAKSEYWRITLCSPEIFDFFAANTQYRQEVPREFFSATPSVKLAVLAGLVDSDGSVSRSENKARGTVQYQMVFSGTNRRLVEQFVELCQLTGIKTGPVKEDAPHIAHYRMMYRTFVNVRSAWDAGLRLTSIRKQTRFEEAVVQISASETMYTASATSDEDRVQANVKALGIP